MVERHRWTPGFIVGMVLLILAGSAVADVAADTAWLKPIFPGPLARLLRAREIHAGDVAAPVAVSLAGGATPVAQHRTNSMPDWLEPRGLSIVELVGKVPEEYLQGMIISYGDAVGIVVYESGTREGDTVVLTTTIYPRVLEAWWAPNDQVTAFNCLGQIPHYDHLGAVVPPSTLRLWDSNGTEVTSEIDLLYITRLGTEQPAANSLAYSRYGVDEYGVYKDFPIPLSADGLEIPANGGCYIEITGVDYYPLTGVFTYVLESPVRAVVLGTQQATFHTYIGVGSMGIFRPLMTQLRSTYPDRHERIPLQIPGGANYFLLKFPPMAGDPYADSRYSTHRNAGRPSGGTYRLSGGSLSTDLTFSAAFPLDPGWRDADLAPGTQFLPLVIHPGDLAPPEYVLPSDIDYDACFTQGNCPSHILERIYNAEMSLEIIFLIVGRTGSGGDWIPLKMAGPGWSPGAAVASLSSGNSQPLITNASMDPVAGDGAVAMAHRLYVPLLTASAIDEQPPLNCPCGWFDSSGRMLFYHPGP